MTLVVARIENGIFAVASDTQVTGPGGVRLPERQGIIKTSVLPGPICVSFCNSAELAKRDFRRFTDTYPDGAAYYDVVRFFERSSLDTGNDYLIGFLNPVRMIRIVDGNLRTSLSKTAWIGDKEAYERFRGYEASAPLGSLRGNAVNAVVFADEMPRSPASGLYSTMRNVVADATVPTVGGFVAVTSSRVDRFRFSVYSDMLYDWPADEGDNYILQLDHPLALGATGQNSEYAICQLSPGYVNINLVAFYLIKGRKLFVYYGSDDVMAEHCVVLSNVQPSQISERLRQALGRDFHWLMMVTTAPESDEGSRMRERPKGDRSGLSVPYFVHANTMPNVK